jgi:hypothetical protein
VQKCEVNISKKKKCIEKSELGIGNRYRYNALPTFSEQKPNGNNCF